MRIIAGQFRSRILQAPKGTATRPTSDRLRETLFNVLGTRVEGSRFVDLYAGSGAVGIEAISRGAEFVWFAEKEKTAVTAIRANLAALKIGNDNNWLAHYHGTANEIWQQTEGAVTHFVAALGTSGTFMGTTRRLRELNPKIRCISMQPDSPFNGLEGLKHMATAIVPPIYDPTLADANIDMATERAYAMAKWLGRNQGLLIGVSAAASVTAALQVAEAEAAAGREAVIVTILCDSADKYLSERFWSDPIAADLELTAKLIPRAAH